MTARQSNILAMTGAVLLFIGLALQFVKLVFAPYVYLAGSILFAYVQVRSGYDGKNIVIRRLRRQQLMGAMLLVFDGSADAVVASQRVDCLSEHCCRAGTLHGFPYSSGGTERKEFLKALIFRDVMFLKKRPVVF